MYNTLNSLQRLLNTLLQYQHVNHPPPSAKTGKVLTILHPLQILVRNQGSQN